MGERDPLRRAARYRVERLAAQDGGPDRAQQPAGDERPAAETSGGDGSGGQLSAGVTGPPQAVGRMERRGTWVDVLVDQAIARGEFDHLEYSGKPLPHLGSGHDPDWWLRSYVEREQVSGVLPEALQLRADAERLLGRLDAQRSEERVRELLEEFNARVVAARRQLLGGPPVVTPLRDVEAEVAAWRDRRRTR